MKFRGLYSDEQGGFRPLRAPRSISKRKKQMKYINVLFIDKHKCAARLGVRSIVGGAIDHSPTCVRL